jgi:type I restriction enzyme S subunit
MKAGFEWPIVKLGDIAEVKGGKRLPKGHDFSESGFKYIRARDIRYGKVTFDEPVYIDQTTRDKIKRYSVIKNDICITIVGINVGDVGIIPASLDGANLTENAAKLIKLKGCSPAYLNYYLQSSGIKDQMQLFSSGAAQDKLGLYKIKLLDIVLPPLGTQNKIAAILSAYDDLIENNKRRIALLEKMAEEIYREWFVRFRFPGYQRAKFEKGIPKEWKQKTFREITDYYIGGGWGEENESPTFTKAGYVIRGTDIPPLANGDYSNRVYRYHKPSNFKSRRLQENDFIFEVSGGSKDQLLGRNLMVSKGLLSLFDGEVMCASFCKQIRFDPKKISPFFMKYYLKLYYECDLVGIYQVQSTGISNYQFESFLNYQTLSVPDSNILEKFDDVIRPIVEQQEALAFSNLNLTKTKNQLLPRLISGKLSVEDLDIKLPSTMRDDQKSEEEAA